MDTIKAQASIVGSTPTTSASALEVVSSNTSSAFFCNKGDRMLVGLHVIATAGRRCKSCPLAQAGSSSGSRAAVKHIRLAKPSSVSFLFLAECRRNYM